MTSRTVRLALCAAFTLLAVGCGGGEESTSTSTEATTSSTAPAEVSPAESEPSTTQAPSTETTTSEAPEGLGECEALEEVANLSAEVDALGSDWPTVQDGYETLGPELLSAFDTAIDATDDEPLANDLTILRNAIEGVARLVASSSSQLEFAAQVSSDPNTAEAEDASDRVDEVTSERCGFTL